MKSWGQFKGQTLGVKVTKNVLEILVVCMCSNDENILHADGTVHMDIATSLDENSNDVID